MPSSPPNFGPKPIEMLWTVIFRIKFSSVVNSCLQLHSIKKNPSFLLFLGKISKYLKKVLLITGNQIQKNKR